MTTGSANVSATGATLSASFSGARQAPTGSGFEWGENSDYTTWPSTNDVYVDKTYTSTSGSFTGTLTGLESGKTYYYRAYVILNNEKYFYGSVKSFTTSISENPGTMKGWLELPRSTSGSDYYTGSFSVSGSRNYSYLYQYSTYTSLWSAYPLYSATMGGGYESSWTWNPNISQSKQVNCWDASYNVLYGETTYVNDAQGTGSEFYARGHQVPNADRNANNTMQSQTFYATNSTPQIHYGFNDGIWKTLEGDVRTIASAADTVYVVTGAAFQKKGVGESITYIHPKGDSGKSVPVPNYYWKVLLKVKWSGSGNNKTVSSAQAIGVWLPHMKFTGTTYSSYVCSVSQIEEWTGFDFFSNLPDNLETTAESNTNWTTFKNF